MGSKAFLVLGLLVAIVLAIPMEVVARDLAETSTNHKQNGDAGAKTNGVYDAKYGNPPLTYGGTQSPPGTYPVNPPPGTYPVNPSPTYGGGSPTHP